MQSITCNDLNRWRDSFQFQVNQYWEQTTPWKVRDHYYDEDDDENEDEDDNDAAAAADGDDDDENDNDDDSVDDDQVYIKPKTNIVGSAT